MTDSSTTVPPGGLVLVTGANGFVGSHIVQSLLNQGYAVRGTVRSEEKATWIKEAMSFVKSTAKFETILIPEATASGAWDNAVKGVNGVVHVAGDMTFGVDPNKTITPMITAVQNLLKAVAKEPSVKRFVMTSSNRAILPQLVNKKITIDTRMWNEEAVEKAWAPPPYNENRTWDIYSALKTQTEQAVWEFATQHNNNDRNKISFVINSVLPCFVIGPILHPKQPGSTGKWVMDFWRNSENSKPLQDFGASMFVDSEDMAKLHIAALTQEDVENERLLAFAGAFNFNSWLEVFRKLDASKAWPEDDAEQGNDLTTLDDGRELELLKRFGTIGWTSFYDSVRRTCFESRTE